MQVGKFEKVSFEQFLESMKDMPFANEWEFYDTYVHDLYEQLKLPTRATSGSAGYDFKAPFSFTLHPGDTIKIPTGIRVKIEPGWWLACVPRSSLGFKYRMQLNNTIGVIDEDYYGSDNEGHIFAKITNDTNEGKDICINVGDGFMQAIFIPYGVTYDDNAVVVRNGGIGSTGAK